MFTPSQPSPGGEGAQTFRLGEIRKGVKNKIDKLKMLPKFLSITPQAGVQLREKLRIALWLISSSHLYTSKFLCL
jgi:hypothetical protein